MKFIINTSFEPYFCAIFNEASEVIDKKLWYEGRKSPQIVWDFLQKNQEIVARLKFLGGVSGPGGFSQLRTGGVVLQSLSFFTQKPIFQARADLVISHFLSSKNFDPEAFALNSFGAGFFLLENKKLQRYELVPETKKLEPIWTQLLPPKKAELFPQKIKLDPEGIEFSTLKILEEKTSQKVFVPDYEYPPVQNKNT